MGELIHLSENSNRNNDFEADSTETTFIENAQSSSAPLRMLTRQMSSDPKLEKKVTFARLLSKMSAEINSGTDFDVLKFEIASVA